VDDRHLRNNPNRTIDDDVGKVVLLDDLSTFIGRALGVRRLGRSRRRVN
jgi:hypothetical protein